MLATALLWSEIPCSWFETGLALNSHEDMVTEEAGFFHAECSVYDLCDGCPVMADSSEFSYQQKSDPVMHEGYEERCDWCAKDG